MFPIESSRMGPICMSRFTAGSPAVLTHVAVRVGALTRPVGRHCDAAPGHQRRCAATPEHRGLCARAAFACSMIVVGEIALLWHVPGLQDGSVVGIGLFKGSSAKRATRSRTCFPPCGARSTRAGSASDPAAWIPAGAACGRTRLRDPRAHQFHLLDADLAPRLHARVLRV